MRRTEYIIGRLFPWLLWMGVIYFFSGQSGQQVSAWINALVQPIIPAMATNAGLIKFSVQKAAHVFEYTVLAVLGWRALYPLWPGRAALLTSLFSLIYALSDEWHQSFVPGRGPSLRDVGIDSLGIALGLMLMLGANALFGHRRDTWRRN